MTALWGIAGCMYLVIQVAAIMGVVILREAGYWER